MLKQSLWEVVNDTNMGSVAAQSVGDWAGKQRVLVSSLMQTNMEGVLVAGTRMALE